MMRDWVARLASGPETRWIRGGRRTTCRSMYRYRRPARRARCHPARTRRGAPAWSCTTAGSPAVRGTGEAVCQQIWDDGRGVKGGAHGGCAPVYAVSSAKSGTSRRLASSRPVSRPDTTRDAMKRRVSGLARRLYSRRVVTRGTTIYAAVHVADGRVQSIVPMKTAPKGPKVRPTATHDHPTGGPDRSTLGFPRRSPEVRQPT